MIPQNTWHFENFASRLANLTDTASAPLSQRESPLDGRLLIYDC